MSGTGLIEPRRLVRAAADRGPSLAEQVASGVHRFSYGTMLHRLRLRGRYPQGLAGEPADPFAGDAEVGRALIAGRLVHAGHAANARPLDWSAAAPAAWSAHAHGFAWLRDLAAADPSSVARVAEPLLRGWLAAFARYDARAWAPETIGRRTLFWTAYANRLLASADPVHRSTFLAALARGHRHLDRVMAKAPDGPPRLAAAAGAVAGGLIVPHAEARLPRAEAMLARALDAFAPDGGLASRAPLDALETLELLTMLAACYVARGRHPPEPQAAAHARLAALVAGVALGDGGLAAFHGGVGVPAARVARALGRAAAPHSAPAGFQRLMSGGTIVVFDAAPPPEAPHAHGAHASTLAFEMSDGTTPLIVSCGGARGGVRPPPPELARLLRMTAAHSTLVVADTSSTRVRDDGRLGRGVTEVSASRDQRPEGLLVEAVHDGYRRRFGVDHRRRLFLCPDGDLRGEDSLAARRGRTPAAVPFDIRFHLGPAVSARIEGDGAFLEHAGGTWRFAGRGATLAIEDSLWFGPDGRVRRTRQLVLSATGPANVAWTLKRNG